MNKQTHMETSPYYLIGYMSSQTEQHLAGLERVLQESKFEMSDLTKFALEQLVEKIKHDQIIAREIKSQIK